MTEVLTGKSMKALGNEIRRKIVKLLNERPYTASELSKNLNKHVTTITEHLTVLENSNLITRKDNKNKWVYYVLTPEGKKLFKPKHYSFTILLSLAAIVVIIGGFWAAIGAGEHIKVGVLIAENESMSDIMPAVNNEVEKIEQQEKKKVDLIYKQTRCGEEEFENAVKNITERTDLILTTCEKMENYQPGKVKKIGRNKAKIPATEI